MNYNTVAMVYLRIFLILKKENTLMLVGCRHPRMLSGLLKIESY